MMCQALLNTTCSARASGRCGRCAFCAVLARDPASTRIMAVSSDENGCFLQDAGNAKGGKWSIRLKKGLTTFCWETMVRTVVLPPVGRCCEFSVRLVQVMDNCTTDVCCCVWELESAKCLHHLRCSLACVGCCHPRTLCSLHDPCLYS